MDFTLLLKGLLVGLCASIPLGPIGVICVQRTVNKGRKSGLASGYGAVLADTLFAAVAVYGLTIIIQFIDTHRTLFQLFGGAIIIALGIITFLRNPLKELRRARRSKSTYLQDIVYVMLLTLTNPLAIFLFLALLAALNVVVQPDQPLQIIITLLGVHVGAFAWWFTLTGLVNRFKARFRLKQLWWFNKIAGVAIIFLGVLAVLSVFFT